MHRTCSAIDSRIVSVLPVSSQAKSTELLQGGGGFGIGQLQLSKMLMSLFKEEGIENDLSVTIPWQEVSKYQNHLCLE